MQKIYIYYGPKNAFEKIIPSDKTTLSEFIFKDDTKHRQIPVQVLGKETNTQQNVEHINNIVAYSESYACMTEGALQRFPGLFENYSIDNLYLQNPPLQVQIRLEQTFPNIIEKKYYEYNTINLNVFKNINKNFSTRIIGQEHVKEQLLSAFYSLVKKTNNKKPIVLMLYGPSGVGKTETAKLISELLKQDLFRRQFSMYHSDEFADYMFGGNHFQNSFAKELLERKSNVILLDEFDKAAPIFYSAFYQLFDEGIFEDKNYRVKVENAIIICTSNYQSVEDIKKHLGDPIYYRIGKFIEYSDLTTEAKKEIINLITSKKYSKLNKNEKILIDIKNLKKLLYDKISLLKNVRHISTLIDEYINRKLVAHILKKN